MISHYMMLKSPAIQMFVKKLVPAKTKKTFIKLDMIGPLSGESPLPVTGGYHSQWATNLEGFCMSWHRHGTVNIINKINHNKTLYISYGAYFVCVYVCIHYYIMEISALQMRSQLKNSTISYQNVYFFQQSCTTWVLHKKMLWWTFPVLW